jgi:hypothetical protein
MTGYQSKKAAAQFKVEGPLHVVCQCDKCKAQPAQEPVAWIQKDMQCDDFDPDSVTCEKPARAADGWEWIPLYITPPQRKLLTIEYQSGYYDGKKAALASLERNFCERCGKRTADLTVIHTCTPPQENT